MREYKALLEKATDIAERCSKIAYSYFRKAVLIEKKQDQTPVTIADKKTEEKIRKELGQAFPSYGIIGEEFGEESKESEFMWTVDPIDGTMSFVRGIPLFGTLLGLLRNGEPVLGVMVLPALNETYSAAKGLGCFCNGTQLKVSATKTLEGAFVCCGDTSAFRKAGTASYLTSLVSKAEVVRGYTDCFGHALVLRGAVDAMIDPLVSIWDVVPIACLVQEAGGEYFSFEGERTVNAKSFITATPALRKPLVDLNS